MYLSKQWIIMSSCLSSLVEFDRRLQFKEGEIIVIVLVAILGMDQDLQ